VKRSSRETGFTYSDWRIDIFVNGSGPPYPDWKNELSMIWSKLENPDVVLKHDHRSFVGIFEVNNVRYVIKKFILQNTSFWFRLTSILFPSRGEIAARNGLELKKTGFLTPRPIILMQRVKNWMVMDSWLVYRFLEGEQMSAVNAVEIVSFVKKMHKAGWIHRDPHPANFIRTREGIAMLDPVRVCKLKNRYLRAYDVVHMCNDMPEAQSLYGRDELGLWFYLAKAGQNIVRLYRVTKHTLKRVLGIKRKST